MAAGRHAGHRDYDYRERDSDQDMLRRRKTSEENERGGRNRDFDRERERDRAREFRASRVSRTQRDRDFGNNYHNNGSNNSYSRGEAFKDRDRHHEKDSEREPGELSSCSLSEEDGSLQKEAEVRKPERTNSSSNKKNNNNSSSNSPARKRRKFSPIVWDLDDKPNSPTDFTEKLPPPPPLTASMRLALCGNSGSPVPNNSAAAAQNCANKLSAPSPNPSPVAMRKETQSSVSPDEFPAANGVRSEQVDATVQKTGSVSTSDGDDREPGQLPDSPPKAENEDEMEDDDEALMPARHISASRWADKDDSAEDDVGSDNERRGSKTRRSGSGDDTEDSRASSERSGSKQGANEVVSPEKAKSVRDDSEQGDAERDSLADPDCYDLELNKRELMDLDETDEDSTSQHADVESPEEPKKNETANPQPPQRMIDMLKGCRSVDEFERLNKIDEGTYGVVYRARNKKTGEVVALKKVKMEKEREGFPLTSLREINVLLSFHHPSIVDVKEVVVGSSLDSIFMVMEYMEHDLKGLMESMKQPFSQSEVKCLMLQLFDGVKYLHDNWVLHRDLKTSNLLLNNRGELKICDFGLARQYGSPLKPYTHMVVTLWYRAPELLLGAKQYSTAIDMWSLGCIMAELLAKEPLFNGKSEIDQLDKIFRTLGTPNEKIWPDFANLPGVKCNFIRQPYNKLREKFPATSFSGKPTLSESGFDLLNRLLTYDPKKRITVEEALRHRWFKEVPLPKSKEFMPTFPARHDHDSRRLRRLLKSPDPLEEQRKKELRQAEFGAGGLFS